MGIEALSTITKAGVDAFQPGSAQTQQVFVQDLQPATTGIPYIWIQTGLVGGGISIWSHNGVD